MIKLRKANLFSKAVNIKYVFEWSKMSHRLYGKRMNVERRRLRVLRLVEIILICK